MCLSNEVTACTHIHTHTDKHKHTQAHSHTHNCLSQWPGEISAGVARPEKLSPWSACACAAGNGSYALAWWERGISMATSLLLFPIQIFRLLSEVEKFRLSALLRQAVKPAVVPFRYRATEGFILRGKILRRIRPVLPRGNYSFQGCTRFWIFW